MVSRMFQSQILYYILTFLMMHTAFYCLEHIHYKYCVPQGVTGFFQSMITGNSSPCVTLRYISTNLSHSSIGIISIIGSLIVSTFVMGVPAMVKQNANTSHSHSNTSSYTSTDPYNDVSDTSANTENKISVVDIV